MGDLLELTGRAEATHFWFHGFRRYTAAAVDEIAGGRRDLRVLECGCGTGYNLSWLKRYGTAFAFDLHDDAVRRAPSSGRPIAKADVQFIPFASGIFDLVASFDVLQTVPDDVRALTEIARVLRPSGHAVLNVAALELLRGDHSRVWGERRRYTKATAAAALRAAGLEVVRLSYLFASLLPLMLAVRSAQRVRGLFREPTGDEDMVMPPVPVNAMLTWVVLGEAALARRLPMPFGSSLLIIAKKR